MEIIYSFVAASAAMVGTLLVLKFHHWSEKNSLFLINFAAGIMIALAFTHLIPEAIAANPNSMLYVLLGFVIMFFLQFVLLFHPCHEDSCQKHTGHFSVFGLSLHSLIDGLIIAVGFEANTNIGLLATVAILFHKLPDGITISGVLVHSGAAKSKILKLSTFTALLTPVGTILGLFLFSNITSNTLGILLAITAGTFIFLAASDLIPETHNCKNRAVPFMFFIGVLVILLTELFLG